MKFKTDTFKLRRRAMFESLAPLDFTYESAVLGLKFGGTYSKDDNQNRRVIFKIDDALYKFGNSGLINFDRRFDVADILKFGNTIEELLDADYSGFVGRKVYPVIALEGSLDAPVKPSLSIAAKVKSYTDIFTRYVYSPEYALTDNAKICNVKADTVTAGNGVVNVSCRLKKLTGWTDWILPAQAIYQRATAIQYRVQYVLSAIDGSDIAQCNGVTCRYVTDSSKLTGDFSEIVTLPVDFDADLKTCYVKAQGKCYVTFSDAPVKRENVNIGQGTGELHDYYLMYGGVVDKNVDVRTIEIKVGDNPIYDFAGKQVEFDYDTKSGTVRLKADLGAAITASWTANVAAENWQEMTLEGDRYVYRSNGGKVSAVRIAGDVQSYTCGWKA